MAEKSEDASGKSESASAKARAGLIRASYYKGVEKPSLDLTDGDELWVKVPAEGLNLEDVERVDPSVSISLKRLRVELENQSYGMISASTGCVSAPGGPSC